MTDNVGGGPPGPAGSLGQAGPERFHQGASSKRIIGNDVQYDALRMLAHWVSLRGAVYWELDIGNQPPSAKQLIFQFLTHPFAIHESVRSTFSGNFVSILIG
jgi:hypothetical protein